MPNITIYLKDEEYFDFVNLDKEEQTTRRSKAKKQLVK